jgi:hypothetical protein
MFRFAVSLACALGRAALAAAPAPLSPAGLPVLDGARR